MQKKLGWLRLFRIFFASQLALIKSFSKTLVFCLIQLTVITSVLALGFIVDKKTTPDAQAKYIQNDNSGSWFVDFKGNNAGLEPDLSGDTNPLLSANTLRQNISTNFVAGTATLSAGQNSGFFSTITITPPSFKGWSNVVIRGNYSSNNDVLVTALDCSFPAQIITGFENLVLGAGNTVDISGIDKTQYPCLRIRVSLVRGTVAPIINRVTVTWSPNPVISLTHTSPTTSPICGQSLLYEVRYSISYSLVEDLVVWVRIPHSVLNSIKNFNSGYGQNLNPIIDSISDGGQFTTTPITIANQTIPEYSVYWSLGKVNAGATQRLTYSARTQNGWQNGIQYESSASAIGSNADRVNSDSNLSMAGNQPLVVTISCSPKPEITKLINNPVTIDSVNYSIPTYNPVITYRIVGYNGRSGITQGIETIFNPVITDDLTSIFSILSTQCGISNPETAISNISNGGSLASAGVLDISGPKKTITWTLNNHMMPNAQVGNSGEFQFSVNYATCPPNTVIPNNVTLTGENANVGTNTDVRISLDVPVRGIFAKGDIVKNSSNQPISLCTASNDDSHLVPQRMGDYFSYLLCTYNSGGVRIDDVVMGDQINNSLEYVSSNMIGSPNVDYVVYYNTGFDSDSTPQTPLPDYDEATGVFGSTWTTTQPTNPSSVKWIAVKIACVASPIFPSPNGDSCFDRASYLQYEIKVRHKPPIDIPSTPMNEACTSQSLTNTGNFYITRASTTIENTDSTVALLPTPVTVFDPEASVFVPPVSNTGQFSSWFFPPLVSSETPHTYSVTITNTGFDTLINGKARIYIPKIKIAGVDQYLDLVNVSGGNVDFAGLSDPNRFIEVTIGTLNRTERKTINLVLSVPRGAKDGESFTLLAEINGQNASGCDFTQVSISGKASVRTNTRVEITKSRDESLINSGGDIHYRLEYTNPSLVSTSPSNNTYIVDQIPSRTVFKQAYTSGVDSNFNQFTCTACLVYFADNNSNLPDNISSSDPFSKEIIQSYFANGIETSPGVWSSPYGQNTKYIAWLVDNQSLNPAQLSVGDSGVVGFTVTNDTNPNNSTIEGSIAGTVIQNNAGVFSDQLIQAISDSVITTILPEPGLEVKKTSYDSYNPLDPQNTLQQNQIQNNFTTFDEFDWVIKYVNPTPGNNNQTIIRDTLPDGIELLSVHHIFDGKTRSDIPTLPTTEIDITSNQNLSIVTNQDGTTSLTLVISDALDEFVFDLGGDPEGLLGDATVLESQQGGYIRLRVRVKEGIVSGTSKTNEVVGYFKKDGIDGIADTSDSVAIYNPDLWIRKFAQTLDPIAGEEFNYLLTISNEGLARAEGVIIRDTLPAGICYVGPSQLSTQSYTVSEPTISTSDCTTSPTQLEWTSLNSVAVGNQIIQPNSPDINLGYKVRVAQQIGQNITLTNQAVISSNSNETPNIFSNESESTVLTPTPDGFVIKDGTLTVNAGSNIEYEITYGNDSKQAGANAYLIDSLPDYNSDGIADLTLPSSSSIITSNNENIYFNDSSLLDPVPTFDPQNPLSNGWTNNFASITHINHIAILPQYIDFNRDNTIDALDQNINLNANTRFSIQYSARTSPTTPISTRLTNSIRLSVDNDIVEANNSDFHTATVPGVDLQITKRGSSEGNVPGIAPGKDLNYTINWLNKGTVRACGIKITDYLPAELIPQIPFSNFSTLSELKSGNGNTIFPVTFNGQIINDTVPVSFVSTGTTDVNGRSIYEWYLGNKTNQSDPLSYLNVCIPAGGTLEFVIRTKVDSGVSDSTIIENKITIEEEYTTRVLGQPESTEDIKSNNESISQTTVYRPELTLTKRGRTVSTNNTSLANTKDTIEYELEYNNSGNISSEDTFLTESIPAGTCFSLNSIAVSTFPNGATIQYSNDKGVSWGYIPTNNPNGIDCNVTNFRVNLGNVPAPSNAVTSKGSLRSNPDYYVSQTLTPFTRTMGSILGDFNEDGHLDVVLTTDNNTTTSRHRLFLGNGRGGFVEKINSFPITGRVSTRKGVTADFNNDGHLDIITSVTSATVIGSITLDEKLFLGDGLGNFTMIDAFPNSRGITYEIGVEDFNGDGNLDVIFGNDDNCGTCITGASPTLVPARQLWLGNGDGSFVRTTNLDGGPGRTRAIVVKDFNNDGHPDFLSSQFVSDELIWINDGNGNFTVSNAYPGSGGATHSALIEDFNGDGYLDSAFANRFGGISQFWLGSASGISTRTSEMTTNTGPAFTDTVDVVSGDFNGDGIKDIAKVRLEYGIDIYFNNGNGNFEYYKRIDGPALAGRSNQTAVADLNNDGLTDFIPANQDVAPKVLLSRWEPITEKTYPIQSVNSTSWSKLIVSQTIPVGTSLEYEIISSPDGITCGTDILIPRQTAQNNTINISSIDVTANPNICLKVYLRSNTARTTTPILHNWQVTYDSPNKPKITFRTVVKDGVTIGQELFESTIPNTAEIVTSTPEINNNKSNNQASYSLNIVSSDLQISKSVDKTAINVGDIASAIPLVYSLHYSNNGPRNSTGTKILDTLPVEGILPLVSIIPYYDVNENGIRDTGDIDNQTSDGDTVVCDVDITTRTMHCSDSTSPITGASTLDLSLFERGSVEITMGVATTTTANTTLINSALISGLTFDPNLDNNEDSVFTIVGDLSNVYIQKQLTSESILPANGNANLGEVLTYRLDYGNNGNIRANDVVVSDLLDTNLVEFVEVNQINGSTPLNCAYNSTSRTVECDPIALEVGETGAISISVRILSDRSILNQTLANRASISTSSPEVSVSDNTSLVTVMIRLLGLSSISGKVFVEDDSLLNGIMDSVDIPLQGSRISLYGVDVFGNIYGPDKALYPLEYEYVMNKLVEEGLITPTTYTASDPYPSLLSSIYPEIINKISDQSSGYRIVAPQITSSEGLYSFTGLNPGQYGTYQTQPRGYISTSSNAGGLESEGNNDSSTPSNGHGIGSIERSILAEPNNSTVSNTLSLITLSDSQNSVENNFGEVLGKIGSTIWWDSNQNGVYDTGELPIPGIEISLFHDRNGDGILDIPDSYLDMNSNGVYDSGEIFNDYNANGVYDTISSGDTFVTSTITNSDGGYVFDNLLVDDGIDSGTNTPLTFPYIVAITDTTSSNPYIHSQSTANNQSTLAHYLNTRGQLALNNNGQNPLGYSVVLNSNFLNSGGINGGDGTTSGDLNRTNYTADFGFGFAQVSGNVWMDSNRNGIQDEDISSRINNVLVTLMNAGADGIEGTTDDTPVIETYVDINNNGIFDLGVDTFIDIDGDNQYDNGTTGRLVETLTSTIQSQAGRYLFTHLPSGRYYVKFDPTTFPTNTVITTQNSTIAGSNTTNNSDANNATTSPIYAFSPAFNLPAGGSYTHLDSGLTQLASLGNYVWNDLNGNGIQDEANNRGVNNVLMTLYSPGLDNLAGTTDDVPVTHDALGNLIAPQLTRSGDVDSNTSTPDQDGWYMFTNLLSGNFFVRIQLPSGYIASTPNQGSNDSRDSDFENNPLLSSYLLSPIITINAGESNLTVDSGIYLTSSISGYNYVDRDDDGIKDNNEEGISGVLVTLLDSSGTPYLDPLTNTPITQTTASDGSYQFNDLPSGTYGVRMDQSPLYADGRDTPSTVLPVNGTTSSNDVISGIVLTSGVVSTNNNFGELPILATITGSIYFDRDDNGIQDSTDPNPSLASPLPIGTTVRITNVNDTSITFDALINADGTYSQDIPAGTYTVTLIVPSGSGYTISNSTERGDGTGANPTTVTVADGQTRSQGKDGLYRFTDPVPSRLGNFTWVDTNSNGIFDTEDRPLSGVLVRLFFENGQPATDLQGLPVPTITTDSNGEYVFQNLSEGRYYVQFESTEDFAPTRYKIGSNDETNSDGRINDTTTEIYTLQAGESNLTIDMGFVEYGSISGSVYEDDNTNGIRDTVELSLIGVHIRLVGVNLYGDTVELTATTGNDGGFVFDKLLPGSYSVEQIQPEGYSTTINSRGTGATNNGAVQADRIISILLTSGQNNTGILFGERKIPTPSTPLHIHTPIHSPSLPISSNTIKTGGFSIGNQIIITMFIILSVMLLVLSSVLPSKIR